MFLGKDVRLSRLVHPVSGRMLAVTVDHPITRGVLPGLVDIRSVMKRVVAGKPDAITMHKGIAEKVFAPYAGQTSIIMKATAYSVHYHPTYDAPVADVEEAVRLGADAISVGCIVGGPDQAGQLTFLGQMSKQAAAAGMPLVAHIYPKGVLVKDRQDAEALAYAVRAGAELGVDIIKTLWTGSAESFRSVIAACPAIVALAGGEAGETLEDYLSMTREALDVGMGGVTYGRFVWSHRQTAAVIRSLNAMMHQDMDVDGALRVFDQVVEEEKELGA